MMKLSQPTLNPLRLFLSAGVAALIPLAMGYWGGTARPGPFFALGLGILTSTLVIFGAAVWWLYFSPLPASAATSALPRRHAAARQVLALMVSGIGWLIITAVFWDELWHRRYGLGEVVNDFFWSPHLMLYMAFGMLGGVAFATLAFAMRGGTGDLRQRFRAEPVFGLVGLVALYVAASTPSDLVWHQVYGLDLTAWSLPHLILAVCGTLLLLANVALQLSLVPLTPWRRGFSGLTIREGAAILIIALAALMFLQISVPEWDGLKEIWTGGDWGADNMFGQAFWARPEWTFTALIALTSLFTSLFAVHALRRAGTATLAVLLACLYRACLLTLFQANAPDTRMTIGTQALLIAPALAVDAWYAFNLHAVDAPRTLVGAVVAGLAGFFCISLPLLPTWFIYPRLIPETLPAIILSGLALGAWGGWMGATTGRWLGTLDRQPVTSPVISLRTVWAALGVLAAFGLAAALFILTAQKPS